MWLCFAYSFCLCFHVIMLISLSCVTNIFVEISTQLQNRQVYVERIREKRKNIIRRKIFFPLFDLMINEFTFRNIVEIGKTVFSSSKILIKFGHKPPTDSTIICTIPLDLLNNFSTTKLFFSFFRFHSEFSSSKRFSQQNFHL